MKKIDYKKLKEITIKTQEELDIIPDDFEGRIYIESDSVIHINKEYYLPVIARGISSVIARDNTHVVAKDNAYIEAWDDSHVVARDYSHVEARENSIIKAWDNSSVQASGNSNVMALGHSSVEAWENSHVEAWKNSNVSARDSSYVEAREFSYIQVAGNVNIVAFGNSYIIAFNNSHVVAKGNTRVIARGNSYIKACENSYIEAFDNSYIEACENSNVKAIANAQVMNKQSNGKVQISGNARIVCMPKNINEFLDFYNIEHTDTKAVFYKAVHRTNEKNIFRSDCDSSFTYVIGKTKTEKCNTDITQDCASGIHISHLDWALNFGSDWNDLAIIECETEISDIIMPKNTDGKVRTSKIKVLREIPLEECGTYGKILANSKR